MASSTHSALLELDPAGAIYVLEGEFAGSGWTLTGPWRRPGFSAPPLSWFLALHQAAVGNLIK